MEKSFENTISTGLYFLNGIHRKMTQRKVRDGTSELISIILSHRVNIGNFESESKFHSDLLNRINFSVNAMMAISNFNFYKLLGITWGIIQSFK